MRKNARILNAFILSILLLGVIVFVVNTHIRHLQYAPIDTKYEQSTTEDLESLDGSNIMGKLENDPTQQ